MMASNFGFGVQACYRGPRLFDSAETRDAVKRWVDWYKRYRDILESDVVHGRRADGRRLDWMLHVNPKLEHRGMLIVHNPTQQTITQSLDVDLYYTGLTTPATVTTPNSSPSVRPIDPRGKMKIPVSVAPGQMAWYLLSP